MRVSWSALMTLFVTVVAAQLEPVEKDFLNAFKSRILNDLGMERLPDLRTVNTSQAQLQRMTRKYLRRVSQSEHELLTYHHKGCEKNSQIVFHPDIDHISDMKWARLRFPNSPSTDVSPQLLQWSDLRHERFSIPCVGPHCCKAKLEILMRNVRTKRSTCDKACCRRSLKISFKEIGWDWIVQPEEFEAFFCKGHCRDATDEFASTHALMQSILNFKGRKIARPCCAPRKLRPLDLLHYNDKTPPELVVTRQKGMIVKQCACT